MATPSRMKASRERIKVPLNVCALKPNKKDSRGRKYAELLFMGDGHAGAMFYDARLFEKNIEYCLNKKVYVQFMGDMCEFATRHSIGAGVYEQIWSPQDQMDYVIWTLKPLADAGLIVGFHSGNHEDRALKSCGLYPSYIMAQALGITYLSCAAWTVLKVGRQKYTMHSQHGKSNARKLPGKINAVEKAGEKKDVDIIAYAHTHALAASVTMRQGIRGSKMSLRKQHLLNTGSYLKHGGYSEAADYEPVVLGSPKLKLFADKFDIHSSI